MVGRLGEIFHQQRVILNLRDMAVDILRHLMLLLRSRRNLGVLVTDIIHRTTNLLEALILLNTGQIPGLA